MTDAKTSNEADSIDEISAEISLEKSIRKGHISSLHQWWARRPNVLARVASFHRIAGASNEISF
jgi:putative DNA methylase